MAKFSFNSEEVDLSDVQSFELVPAGKYLVVIEDTSMSLTKSGTGEILKVRLNILEGPYANRKIFLNLNVKNDSHMAEKIARQAVAQMSIAAGVPAWEDTAELHGKLMIVDVTIRKNGEYENNDVRKFSKAFGQPVRPEQAQQKAVESTGAAKPNGPEHAGIPPWKRGRA